LNKRSEEQLIQDRDLIKKIEKVLLELNKKRSSSDEVIIDRFINLYLEVLNIVKSKQKKELSEDDFIKIKTLGRAYLETSSDYRQDFLYAMSDVENAIKKYF
jgi:hypothetical protein